MITHIAKLFRRIGAVMTLTLFSTSGILGQPFKPAVEYQSLMNMRYYEADGGFLVENLQVVFPPANIGNAKLVITDQSGIVVVSVPLRYERMQFPAFGRFRPSGHPGNVTVGRSGSFVMSVVLDGQTITAMPFTLKEEQSTDPFNPVKRFVRDGPWRELAYFSIPPADAANQQAQFNWWMSTRELPAGMRRPRVTIHLLVNGKEIAASPGAVVPDTIDWYFYQHKELIMPILPKNRSVTLADMTAQNGEVALLVKANGQPIKTYKTQARGGQLQRLPSNALDFEPHSSFISPRFIDTSQASPIKNGMFEMFWIKKQ